MKIGSFSLIKEINTSAILNIIRKNKIISRAQIASITGLTPATVTNITSKLLDINLISESRLGISSGGRKPVLLEINSQEYNVGCIIIGRHKTSVAVYDLAGNLIISEEVSIKNMNAEDSLLKLSSKFLEFKNNIPKRILGIGVSCEGLIDQKNGICVFSANLNWDNVNIKGFLEEKTELPVFVDNDVKVIALGEKWFGDAQDTDDFILFYTGYGIGISVMTNGEIFRGSQNYSGELGHTIIDAEGPVCTCGNKGCLQSLASGSALLRELFSKGLIKDDEPSINEIIELSKTNKEIEEILNKHAYYIGIGAANAINVFNPSELILNGYVSHLSEKSKKILEDTINNRCLKSMKPGLKTVYSELGSKAIEKGAAALTISNLYSTPSAFFGDKYEL